MKNYTYQFCHINSITILATTSFYVNDPNLYNTSTVVYINTSSKRYRYDNSVCVCNV